jgi:alpha-beta hydrolase superfamily lysophospholipase
VSALPPPSATSVFFRAGDGTRLHALRWDADHPRAVVLLSPGLGEHAGRYAAFARDLVPLGISVRALDHRGHGRSGGMRGYARRFSLLVDDFERFRRRLTEDVTDDTPVFVLGHSFGGLVVIRWIEATVGLHPPAPPSAGAVRTVETARWNHERPRKPREASGGSDASHPAVAGAILSAPLLGVAVKAPRWKVAISGVLSKALPWLPFSNEIDPAELSADPAYIRSYREDPLVHARITPRLYTEFVAAIGDAFREMDHIHLPTLFLVPEADTVVHEPDVVRFAESLRGDVTIRRYAGFRHESLNDLERDRPVSDVVAWIEARIGGS